MATSRRVLSSAWSRVDDSEGLWEAWLMAKPFLCWGLSTVNGVPTKGAVAVSGSYHNAVAGGALQATPKKPEESS